MFVVCNFVFKIRNYNQKYPFKLQQLFNILYNTVMCNNDGDDNDNNNKK